MNDPVMGGQSSCNFTVADGVGVLLGQVADVPYLKAPGFIQAQAGGSERKPCSTRRFPTCEILLVAVVELYFLQLCCVEAYVTDVSPFEIFPDITGCKSLSLEVGQEGVRVTPTLPLARVFVWQSPRTAGTMFGSRWLREPCDMNARSNDGILGVNSQVVRRAS